MSIFLLYGAFVSYSMKNSLLFLILSNIIPKSALLFAELSLIPIQCLVMITLVSYTLRKLTYYAQLAYPPIWFGPARRHAPLQVVQPPPGFQKRRDGWSRHCFSLHVYISDHNNVGAAVQ